MADQAKLKAVVAALIENDTATATSQLNEFMAELTKEILGETEECERCEEVACDCGKTPCECDDKCDKCGKKPCTCDPKVKAKPKAEDGDEA